ncbi:efflux RND transporter periplasmic adaptor subunit [Bradyrhizobium denitrificans]|jgi:HlyD family secretion protein|uniref:Efflux RND transporter periplasmic adaptor subunit n=3 Tax=Nitrobacteraceae TaxID=41294 RepID=A0ABS5G4I5_9BRAD|nr:efflux RND transporter periplasmic adaptor subunit [Bradyrhizobium denitrificans]MDU6490257.1 efflux RND transporter periplasmic adaptor subunit [Bradyrhizobium sp.]NPU22401.1 efflux RND transporter periplasmic adaptor subunit [Bradyrhizobium sp. LMG 8443]
MLAVTVCVAMFAVSGARRQQVEAAAAQISDPRRDAGERSGAAPIATTLARAERHSITETLAVTGSLVAREENVVGAEVDGLRIVELLADVGDRVEAGQVLARLDGTMLRTQLAQNTAMIAIAQASVAQMQASMAEMQANEAEAADALNRTLTLNSTGTISPAQLLARETQAKVAAAKSTAAAENLRMAKAEEAFAEAQRGEIELKIARTELKAPTAGIISHRAARLGAVTGTAGEPLFRLIRNGQIEFDAEVPETVLPQIEPAQDVEVWLPGVSQSIRGHVRLVDPIVDKASRLGRVAVALSPHAAMRAGVFARGSITLGKRQAVTVPLSAVSFSKNGSYVQLATNNVVELRNVQTGLARGTRVEIVSGLIEGQEVVVRAAAFVRPGDRILPVRSDAGSAGED